MSTPRDLIAEELDAALREQIDANETYQKARRVSNEAQSRVGEIAGRAQRLRLALFALDGEKPERSGSYAMADANSANHARLVELKALR